MAQSIGGSTASFTVKMALRLRGLMVGSHGISMAKFTVKMALRLSTLMAQKLGILTVNYSPNKSSMIVS